MENVIEVFVVYVHATLSNGCAIHASIMGTSTRWKITKCDVINFLIRSNLGRKRENITKSKVRKEVHPNNNFSYIPCTLLVIAMILVGALQLRRTCLPFQREGILLACVGRG